MIAAPVHEKVGFERVRGLGDVQGAARAEIERPAGGARQLGCRQPVRRRPRLGAAGMLPSSVPVDVRARTRIRAPASAAGSAGSASVMTISWSASRAPSMG